MNPYSDFACLATTILIATLMFSLRSEAQTVVTLTLNDGTVTQTELKATSRTQMFVTEATYNFSDIQEARFQTPLRKDRSTYSRFLSNDVKISFQDGSVITAEELSDAIYSEALFRDDPNPPSELQVTQDFKKFTSQSETGKGLMLLGIGITTVAAFLQAKYAKDNSKVTNPDDLKFVSSAIPIAGGVVFVVGIAIDLDARKHLRIVH